MALGPTGDEYVKELLSKERAWLVYSATRSRVNNDQESLRKVNAIDMYLRNGPVNLIPSQAQDVIDALDHAYLITPVSNEEDRASWGQAVAQARAELVPFTTLSTKSTKYKFRRG